MSSYTGTIVKVHRVQKTFGRTGRLRSLEQARNAPLSAEDPQFQIFSVAPIHQPGLHIGVDEKWKIVFVARITFVLHRS
jgi:hypothetical protein